MSSLFKLFQGEIITKNTLTPFKNIIFSQTIKLISTKLGTKHLWVKATNFKERATSFIPKKSYLIYTISGYIAEILLIRCKTLSTHMDMDPLWWAMWSIILCSLWCYQSPVSSITIFVKFTLTSSTYNQQYIENSLPEELFLVSKNRILSVL